MIFRYILQNCRNPDGSFTITEHEMRSLRIEYMSIRRLAHHEWLAFDYYAKRDGFWRAMEQAHMKLTRFFKRSKGR